MPQQSLYHLTLAVLAIWRVTHLLAKEDGPWDAIVALRLRLGNGFLGSLMDCFYCLSIWTALPFGIWLGQNWIEKILVWLALSGVAALLEQATTKNDSKETATFHED